jgi:hypothetical protein
VEEGEGRKKREGARRKSEERETE